MIVLGGVFIPITNVGAQPIDPNSVKIDTTKLEQINYTNPCSGNQVARVATDGTVTCVNPTTRTGVAPGSSSCGILNLNPGLCIVEEVMKSVGSVLMSISALILSMVGWLFDKVISYTIVDMAKNIGNPEGVGGSISLAWATLRDIANMVFIFALLYAAFKAMFDTNFGSLGKTVRDIVIVALLINFSLFFSKVVIDASNIVSVGFYNSITQANVATLPNETAEIKGITAGYMNVLGINGWYAGEILDSKMDWKQILTTGVMGSIFMLITAVIFLISAVMLASRFIILIFIMILSPLALIAYIIPGQKKQFDTWLKALVDQAFFAPLFFALTWVALKLASAPNFLGDLVTQNKNFVGITTSAPSTSGGLVLNYVLVIGFAIAALVFSKKMASSTPYFGAITGAVGTGVIGGAALASRHSVGRGANAIAQSQWLKDKAETSRFARAGLWTAQKTSESSFDVRALADTKLGKATGAGKILGDLGKAGGKDGFSKAVDEKAERKAKYAKRVYGQTAAETAEANKLKPGYEAARAVEETRIKQARNGEFSRAEEARKKYLQDKIGPSGETAKNIKADRDRAAAELGEIERLQGKSSVRYFQKEKDVENLNNRVRDEEAKVKAAQEAVEATDEYNALKEKSDLAKHKTTLKVTEDDYSETFKETDENYKSKAEAGKRRLEAYAKRLEGKFKFAGNVAAAQKVRDLAQGKGKGSKKDLEKYLRDNNLLEKEEGGGGSENKEPPKGGAPDGGETKTK